MTFGVSPERLDHERFLEQLQLFAEIKGWRNFNQLHSAWAHSPLIRADWASFLFASPQVFPAGTLRTIVSQVGDALGKLLKEKASSRQGLAGGKGAPIKLWVVQHSTQPAILIALAAVKRLYERGLLPDLSVVRIRLSQLDALVEPWRIQTCASAVQFLEHLIDPIQMLSAEASHLLADVAAWEPLSQLFENILFSQLTESSVSPFASGHLCVISHADGVLKSSVLQHINWLASHALVAGGVLWVNQPLDPSQAHELHLSPCPISKTAEGGRGLFIRTVRRSAQGAHSGVDYLNHAMSVLSERVRRASVFTAMSVSPASRTTADTTGRSETSQIADQDSQLEAAVDLILETVGGPAIVFQQDGFVLGYSGQWPLADGALAGSFINRSDKTLDALLPAPLLTRVQRTVLELSLRRTAGHHGVDEDFLDAQSPSQFGEPFSRFRLKRLRSRASERLHLLEWMQGPVTRPGTSTSERAETHPELSSSVHQPLGTDLFRRIQSSLDNQSHQKGLLAKEIQFLKKSLQKSLVELTSVRKELEAQIALADDLGSDLHGLMEACTCPVLVLNERLQIESFSPLLSQQFGLRRADRERPVTDFSSLHQSVEGALAASLAGLSAMRHQPSGSRCSGAFRLAQSLTLEETDTQHKLEHLTPSASEADEWRVFRRFSRGQYRGFILAGVPSNCRASPAPFLPLQSSYVSAVSTAPLAQAAVSHLAEAAQSAVRDFLASAGNPVALEEICDFMQTSVTKMARSECFFNVSSCIQFQLEKGSGESVSVSEADICTFLVLLAEVCKLAPESMLICKFIPDLPNAGFVFELTVPRILPQTKWHEKLVDIKNSLLSRGLSGFTLTQGKSAFLLTGRLRWQTASLAISPGPLTIVKPLSAIVLYADQEQKQSIVSALDRRRVVTSCFSLYSSFISHIQRLDSSVDLVFASQRVLRTVSVWPQNGWPQSDMLSSWQKVAHKIILIADDSAQALNPAPGAERCGGAQRSTGELTHESVYLLSYPFLFQELVGFMM